MGAAIAIAFTSASREGLDMLLSRAVALRSIAVSALAAATLRPAVAQQPATVLDLVASQLNLTTFTTAVKAAGLESELTAAGPVTLFAPTDAAFAKLPAADRDALLKPEGQARLRTLVLGHLIRDNVRVRDGDSYVSSGWLPSAAGTPIAFGTDGNGPTIGRAHPVKADMQAGNGLVTTIDRVLQ
jgi:uncharacterized surface protein with fasciclin (FAS1) repeats